MHAIPLLEDETYYPDSDGEPVAETPVHLEEMVYVWEVLDERFEDDPDVCFRAIKGRKVPRCLLRLQGRQERTDPLGKGYDKQRQEAV